MTRHKVAFKSTTAVACSYDRCLSELDTVPGRSPEEGVQGVAKNEPSLHSQLGFKAENP